MDDEQPDGRLPRRAQQRKERRVLPPLAEPALRDLALAYAARYATTRARLLRYLARKLQERGWAGDAPPDQAALADRLVELRYVDDAAFAHMKGRAMASRGLGRQRVEAQLAAAGVAEGDRGDAPDEAQAMATAVNFAQRTRLGPFARVPADDPKARRKQFAAMLRAGHAPAIARRVLSARSVAEAEALVVID
jgi:regulatory protein